MSSEPSASAVAVAARGDGKVAIRVRSITKSYQIYGAPRDRLKQFVLPRLAHLVGKRPRQYYREFSALHDVSFDVNKGETVGIIGRNGAGKSTLLQVLCGTLSATSGTVEINGRVAALLELGSGFNPEFTGRENIHMNASVLGLSRKEIEERFDDIVGFADIGDFLDQPVKTYSSGMYVRLAFAVVVHVDADILIVDEALSVGDMYFQAKCMAHMKRLMDAGVTVLFVSHDVGSVKALCSRAVYLERGAVVSVGPTEDVVEAYYGVGVKSRQFLQSAAETCAVQPAKGFSDEELADQADFSTRAAFHRLQNGMAELLDVQLLDQVGKKVELIDFLQNVCLRVTFKANIELPSLGLAYHIRDRNGFDVIYSDTGIERCHVTNLRAGEIVVMDWQFKVSLREGAYTVAVMLSIPQDLSIGKVEVCDFAPLAANLRVSRGMSFPIYAVAYWSNKVTQRRFGG